MTHTATINTGWEPLPTQERLLDSTAELRVFCGGIGAGKSVVGSIALLEGIAGNVTADRHYLEYGIVAPSYPMGDKKSFTEFKNVLTTNQIDFEERKSAPRNIFIPLFNAKVWFMSAQIPTSFLSIDLAGVWVDEPFIQKEIVFLNLLGRMRSPFAKRIFQILTGTPEQLNWGYQLMKPCVSNGDMVNIDGQTRQLFTASTFENYHLPEQYVKTLLSHYDEQMIQSYVYGNPVPMNQAAIFYNYDSKIHSIDLEYQEGWINFITFDFNVDPMTVLFGQYATDFQTGKLKIHILNELSPMGSNIESTCQKAALMLRDYNIHHERDYLEIYGDASGGNRSVYSQVEGQTGYDIIKTVFKTANYIIPNGNPQRQRGIDGLNGLLLNSRKETTLFIDPKCIELHMDLIQGNYYPNTKTENHSDKARGHKVDALRYFVEQKIQQPRLKSLGKI